MTRRRFALMLAAAEDAVEVPLTLVFDQEAALPPELLARFRGVLWPEAQRDFAHSGVRFAVREVRGEIWRPEFREPLILGLERGRLNLVVTGRVPMSWDGGRGLNGVTLAYRGFHVCVVALRRAYGHRIPLLAVNTCVHELLHALLGDIFEDKPKSLAGQAREVRVDAWATRMWLLGGAGGLREAARRYVERLKREASSMPE